MSRPPREKIMAQPAEPVGPPVEGVEEKSSASERGSTRRQMLTTGAALAATLFAPARKAAAQRIVRPPTRRPPTPTVDPDVLLRLVARVTNGITTEELGLADAMGFRRYLEYHLDAGAIHDSAVESFVAATWPDLSLDGTGLYQLNQGQLLRELTEAMLYRAAFSKRQLYERMVHFWSDHFNIYYSKVNYLKLIDDRDVIRKHALGTFPDLLRASAHSPAMLEYLDNTRSRGKSPNQNYARELMELHTLGVDGGYTQTDVEEVTKALTGWTIAGRGQFRFDPAGHDFTAKTVLGVTIPASAPGDAGVQDGEMVLDILIGHPSTARFIATKMSRWLLQYEPTQAIVDDVAATYTRTGGDIPSMIRTILTPANLLAAPPKYKQPVQLVLSTLRATAPTVTGLVAIANNQMRTIGQPLFQWEEPDGYPDNVDWWAGGVLQRWNFCSYLTGLSRGEVIVDVSALMQVNTPSAIAGSINQRAFAGQITLALQQRVTDYLAGATINETRVREAFALALSSSEFQWY
jgi:Protein of unknown function (DUF1800)